MQRKNVRGWMIAVVAVTGVLLITPSLGMGSMMGSYGWMHGGIWSGNWWLWGIVMSIGMLLFWGLLVWGVWMLVKHLLSPAEDDALRVLRERYARGEINSEAYKSILSDLHPKP